MYRTVRTILRYDTIHTIRTLYRTIHEYIRRYHTELFTHDTIRVVRYLKKHFLSLSMKRKIYAFKFGFYFFSNCPTQVIRQFDMFTYTTFGRYLKLSYYEIEELPESICNLCNLQSLDVSECEELEKLPQEIGKGEEICKLGELEHLNHIQGTLVISGLKNVVDFGAIENILKRKNHLCGLYLLFDTLGEMNNEFEEEEEETKKEEEEEETEEERRRKMEKDVAILNALEPPLRLELLEIGYYKGTTIRRRRELSESSKNNNNKDIIILPNLKSLIFRILEEWEEWTGMGGTIEEEEKDNSANAFVTNNTPKIKIMPLLHSLKICWCGKLKSLPDYLRNTPLQELEIYVCPILQQLCERWIGDYWPNISHIPNIKIDDKYVQRDSQLPDTIDSEFQEALMGSFYSSVVFDEKEDVILPVSDEKYAEESQFQEALMGSLITSKLANNEALTLLPLLSSPTPTIQEILLTQEPKPAKEAGESSYSFCEICVERKDSNQMFKTESCVHSFCSDCIGKHVATKIQESITVVTCPGLDCKGVIELDACRAVLPKVVLDSVQLRIKAMS
ncbi:hypothetical protein SO802_007500 [Lithocarpus litseifolius]|uniref:RING-type domain-containing protein n=1 Tax=Lithocarpus litseifolius TaxID=425828 RepID=A0AAW2DRD4_9ROSI